MTWLDLRWWIIKKPLRSISCIAFIKLLDWIGSLSLSSGRVALPRGFFFLLLLLLLLFSRTRTFAWLVFYSFRVWLCCKFQIDAFRVTSGSQTHSWRAEPRALSPVLKTVQQHLLMCRLRMWHLEVNDAGGGIHTFLPFKTLKRGQKAFARGHFSRADACHVKQSPCCPGFMLSSRQ